MDRHLVVCFLFFSAYLSAATFCAHVLQDSGINRLRAKAFELKRDIPDIESICRELQTSAAHLARSKAQVKLQQEQAANLQDEKSVLEYQVANLQQKTDVWA